MKAQSLSNGNYLLFTSSKIIPVFLSGVEKTKALLLMLILCTGLPVGRQAFVSMNESLFDALVLNILPSSDLLSHSKEIKHALPKLSATLPGSLRVCVNKIHIISLGSESLLFHRG